MKLTSIKLKKLCDKIVASRSRLLITAPFFSLFLMHLDFYASDMIKTASINGRGLYFSPSYLEKLYDDETDLLLCHLSVHILMNDMEKDMGEVSESYHHACDMINNNLLCEYLPIRPNYPHLGKLQMNTPFFTENIMDADAEKVFSSLIYRIESFPDNVVGRMMIDTSALWHKSRDELYDSVLLMERDRNELYYKHPEKEENKKDEEDEDDKDDKEDKKDEIGIGEDKGIAAIAIPGGKNGKDAVVYIRCADTGNGEDGAVGVESNTGDLGEIIKNVVMSVYAIRGKGAGNAPALEERLIQRIPKTDTDWRTLLSEFVQEEICDYSFSPPDRRFSDSPFMLPDFNDSDLRVRNILFMIDTSGSMCEADIEAAYGEIVSAVEQFGGKLCGMVGFFDTVVSKPRPFVNEEDIKKILPYGGGGTDFFSVFDYVRENMHDDPPASIIIMTDGEAEYPDESEACGIPVMWLLNNEYITPPWGRVVRMKTRYDDEYE